MNNKIKFAQAEMSAGSWKLAKNDIWNIPDNQDEIRFDIKTQGPWGMVSELSALAIDSQGRVYGIRKLQRPRESGYHMEGRVTVNGKTYRGFTSNVLFERENGSLCNVAVIYVCNSKAV